MERFQRILQHEKYKESYEKLRQLEEKREFCLHDMQHFLDVARLTYIFVLEQHLDVSRDVIYGIAVLHDMGRVNPNLEHEVASAKLAQEILPDCGYSKVEQAYMKQVILSHRKKDTCEDPFVRLFYQADKMARNCMECQAYDQCYWSEDKKNHQYNY